MSSAPPSGAESPATEGAVIAGRYQLRERIGVGGMSSIWVADDRASHAQVAVKVMVKPEKARNDLVERFRREAEVAKRLRGPHFVAVLDHGEHEGTPFMVMQLLEGENLQQRLTRRGTLDIEETQALLVDIAGGLRVAHAAGVIHRDLKPANLYFARLPEKLRSNREEVVKILDFGIARSDAFAGRLTAAGSIVGSLFYMSPEQARAEGHLDARSDLWQVGAVLYRCLTGRRAFEGSPGIVLHRLVREDVAPASDANPSLPRALDPFFARALARKPEERFQTIDDMVKAFRDVARSISGTRPAIKLQRQELPTLHGDSEYSSFARTSTTPSEPPAARQSKPRFTDPPTVHYTSLSPAPFPSPVGGVPDTRTPPTVPAYFSRDRMPSGRPSPWAIEATGARGRRADWWLFVLLIVAIVGIAGIGVVSVLLE